MIKSVTKNRNEIMVPIIIAVNAVMFGGVSIFASPLYGEKYFLNFTIVKARNVIMTVETIHQTTNQIPCSESRFSIPVIRS